MSTKHGVRERSIRGYVTPAEWDEEDTVTAVCVETDDNERFFVDSRDRGGSLLDHLDVYMEVTGTVREEDGESYLTVHRFREMETGGTNEDSFEDDDEEDEGYEDDDEDFDDDEADSDEDDEGWDDEGLDEKEGND